MQELQFKAVIAQLNFKLSNLKQELAEIQDIYQREYSKLQYLQYRRGQILVEKGAAIKYKIFELNILELNKIDQLVINLNKQLIEYRDKIKELKIKLDSLAKCLEKFKAKYRRFRSINRSSIELFASEELESIVSVLGLLELEHGSRNYY